MAEFIYKDRLKVNIPDEWDQDTTTKWLNQNESVLDDQAGIKKLKPETGLAEAVGAISPAVGRGILSAQQAKALSEESLGANPEKAAQEVAALEQRRQAMAPPTENIESIKKAKEKFDAGEYWQGIKELTPSAFGTLMGESFGASAPSLIGGAVGTVAGGAVAGPVGARIVGGILASLGSGAVDYGAGILELMQEKGIDVSNAQEVTKALTDPTLINEMKAGAAKHAIPVAIFDGLSFGIAGAFVKGATSTLGKVGRGTAELAAQSGMGMAGEAGGQLAQHGQIKSQFDVAAEGLMELPTGVAEIAIGSRVGGKDQNKDLTPAVEKALTREEQFKRDFAVTEEEGGIGSKFVDTTGTAIYDPREGLGDKLVSKFESPDKAISPAFWMKQTEAKDLDEAKAQMASYARNGYLIEKDGKYYPNPKKPLEAEAPHEFTQRLKDRLSITENVGVPEQIEANPYDPQTEPEKYKAYQDFEDSKKFNEQARAQLDAEEKEQARIQREIAARVPQTENFLVQQELAAQKKAEEENFKQRQEAVVARDQAEREAAAEQKAGEFSQKLWNEKAPEITQRDQQLAPTRETVAAAQESQTPQGPTSTEATVGAAQELFEGADAKEVTKATRNFFETATPGEKFTVGDIQGKQRQEGGISTPQHARELISDAINNDRVHVDEEQNLVVGPSPFSKTKQADLNKEWGVVKPKKPKKPKKGGVIRANKSASLNAVETDEDIKNRLFNELADAQRGHPESAMLRAQGVLGGGILSNLLEHIGDLTHRVSEFADSPWYNGLEFALPKIERGLNYIKEYGGFAKEVERNHQSNYNFRASPDGEELGGKIDYTYDEFKDRINKVLQKYIEEHKKLRVYNRVQMLSREAAISVAEKDGDTAVMLLRQLRDIARKGPEQWLKEAREFKPDFVDFRNPTKETNAQILEREKTKISANQAASIYQSILKSAVDNLKQEKGSGEQMLAMIQKSPGVKQEEIVWMDLDTFLKSKKSVTKKEIQDYMDQNAIDLKDADMLTEKGIADEITDDDVVATATGWLISRMIRNDEIKFYDDGFWITPPSLLKDNNSHWQDIKFSELLDKVFTENSSRQMKPLRETNDQIIFSMQGYDREGVRRHLINFITDHEAEIFTPEELSDVRDALEDRASEEDSVPYSGMVLNGPATDYSVLKLEFTPKQGRFSGGHWGQNTFGHIRTDVRKLVDGVKVLFGNEFQSDWASQQRKIEGVNFSKRGAEEEIKRLNKQLADMNAAAIDDQLLELKEQQDKILEEKRNILREREKVIREYDKVAGFDDYNAAWNSIADNQTYLLQDHPEYAGYIEEYNRLTNIVEKILNRADSIEKILDTFEEKVNRAEKINNKIASLYKYLGFQNASLPDLRERVKKAYVENGAAQQDFNNFVNDFAKNVKSLADKMGILKELKDEFKSLDFYYHAGEIDTAAVERSKKRIANILDNHKIRDISRQDIDKAFELNNKRFKTADEYRKLSSKLEEYRDVADNKMAEAPWMHTWLPLLFRKFVKHAVEIGQDGVAWPSQASQVEQIEGWGSGAAHSYAGIVKNYTERLPQYAKEWGKKFGVRPELKELENGEKVWFMPINDQMRASVRNGVPLFAKNLSDYQATIKAPSAQAIVDNEHLNQSKGGFSALLRGTPIEKYAREFSKLIGVDVPITYISKRELAYALRGGQFSALKDAAFKEDSSWRGMQISHDSNGEFQTVIIIDDQTPVHELPSVMAHEIGHVMEEYYFHNAPEDIKKDVIDAWKKQKKINIERDVTTDFFAPLSAISSSLASHKGLDADQLRYYNSFKEWFAEQTAKWSQSDKRPVTLLEKFFHKAYEIVKQFFMSAIGKHYLPTDAFQRFMDYSLSNKITPTVGLSPVINYALAANKELTKVNPAKGANETTKFMSGWSKLTDSASNVAAKHKEATGYVNATNAMYEHANEIIAEEAPLVESYINLPKAQQERVAKVLLIGNIARQEYSPVNGNIVAVATDSIANTDVKKGDTITLTGPEVKAYLDFRKLFSDLKKKTLEVYSDNEKAPPSMNLQGYIPLIRQGEGLIVGTKQGSDTAYVEAIKKKPFESHAHFVQRMKARAEEVNNENPGMYITHGEFNKNNFNSWELEKRLGYLNAIEMLEGAAGDKEISDFLEAKKKEYMGKSFKRHSIQRKEVHVQGYIAKGMSPADYISSAVGDYLAKSAHRIARQKYAGQIAKEVKVVEAANNPNLTKWVHEHHNYINSPQEEYGYVRAVAFHGLLGFNISSAVMNFFQPFQSTLPVLAANSNPVRATAAVLKGIGQVFRLGIVAIPRNQSQFHSFGFNEKALSKLPPELADILRNAYKKGHLTSTTQAEVAIRNEAVGGRFGKMWTNLLQASSYAFGAIELANRMATHIAAYELYKNDPKFVKNMEVLQKNSRFRDRQMNPAVAAEMINEMTQFNTSKANRPEMMRGVMTIPTQFMNYSIYSLELWGNALRGLGGSEGKAVAGQTLAYLSLMLFFMAGTMGMPFADNLDKFLRYLTKHAGMREFNLEYEVEKFWRSMGLSETSVRAMTHGKLGELLGVHIGPRLGLGNVIGGLSPNAVGGPAISMTMDKIDRAAADLRANRVGDAIVHGLLPQAMSNLHEAMVAGERGFQDRRLNVQMTPQQIAKENEGRVFPIQVAKGMGFTPQPLQNMRNIQQGTRYLEERNKPLKKSYMDQLGDALLQSHFARQAGDMERSERLKQEFQQILLKARREDMETLKSGHPEDILKIDPQAVFKHVRENMLGALSPELVKGLPLHLRKAAMELRNRNND